jgi:hypothetical protein
MSAKTIESLWYVEPVDEDDEEEEECRDDRHASMTSVEEEQPEPQQPHVKSSRVARAASTVEEKVALQLSPFKSSDTGGVLERLRSKSRKRRPTSDVSLVCTPSHLPCAATVRG